MNYIYNYISYISYIIKLYWWNQACRNVPQQRIYAYTLYDNQSVNNPIR